MRTPPISTARRCPVMRSATQPPARHIRYTMAVYSPYTAPALESPKPRPPVGDLVGHEQDQDGAHPVVAEPLPHLGEEQGGQAAGVAEKAGVGVNGLGGLVEFLAACHKGGPAPPVYIQSARRRNSGFLFQKFKRKPIWPRRPGAGKLGPPQFSEGRSALSTTITGSAARADVSLRPSCCSIARTIDGLVAGSGTAAPGTGAASSRAYSR